MCYFGGHFELILASSIVLLHNLLSVYLHNITQLKSKYSQLNNSVVNVRYIQEITPNSDILAAILDFEVGLYTKFLEFRILSS
jgi:hypothetical protein